MLLASEIVPGTESAQSMLPSLGFFGGTWADCLRIPVSGRLVRIRIERADQAKGFLNLRGVLARKRGKTIEAAVGQVSVSQSSNRVESHLKPQGITELNGIHTVREVGAWWQADISGGLEIDELLVFNRTDPLGSRGRTLRVLVDHADGGSETVYDSTSAEFLKKRVASIEQVAGGRIACVEIRSVADARKWRTDASNAVAEALRRSRMSLTTDEWLAVVSLIPTSIGSGLGDDLEGSDWFLLAYYLCAQVFRDPRSRSGVHAFAHVLNSVERLDRLESEFDDATRAMGAPEMQHVRHGISPKGQLRKTAPGIARLVSQLREDLSGLGSEPLIAYGSLLGAVRDKELLAHDDDFDLFLRIPASSREEFDERKADLLTKLEGAGWKVSLNKNYMNCHLSREGVDGVLDAFAVWIEGDLAWTHMESMKWRSLPSSWFEDGELVEVDGICIVAPAGATDFLRERYGDGWERPDKYFDWRWKLGQ